MLAVGLVDNIFSSSELDLEDDRETPIKEVNHLVYNLFQGEQEDSSLASPDDEAIDHLLVEQHVVETLDDDAMYLSSRGLENCFSIGGNPCSIGYYDQRDDYGIFNADADSEQVGKQALKYEFMLQGAEENENNHATCNLLCDCSDFLLESGSAESLLLDYPSNNEATVIGMKSARQIQCIERDSDEVKSLFPYFAKKVAITEIDHTNAPQCSSEIHGSHSTVKSTDSLNVSLEDPKWLKHGSLFDKQNLTGLGSVSDIMDTAFLSIENEDDMILIPGNEISESGSSLLSISPSGAFVSDTVKDEVPCADAKIVPIDVSGGAHEISEEANDSCLTNKRLRKPTRRYIEETSEIKSRCSFERFKISLISSKDKHLHARTEEKHHWSDAMQLIDQDYPRRLHSLRARRRKITKQLGNEGKEYATPNTALTFYDSDLQDDDASDESATTHCQRRKHHRQWTLSEAVKLVDGVSQFGVGRWTEIKRLWFSASAYRTAVDLKDKWRNLLRASIADSENRNPAEAQQRKQTAAYIPQSILQRVRDLSIIHPYPRSQKLRLADLPAATPPTSGRRRSSDASVSRGRILRRRSFSQ